MTRRNLIGFGRRVWLAGVLRGFSILWNGYFVPSWGRFWMRFAGLSWSGRIATRVATWFSPPYYERCYLSRFNPKGYIAPSAIIHHPSLTRGSHVFIGDRVMIFERRQEEHCGSVELGDNVQLFNDVYIQTGAGGTVKIGASTHIQPRCQFSAYKGSIQIGCSVEIAPNCAFYPYDHGMAPGEPIRGQPLRTKGGIVVGDDVWLGIGVIVLDGVRIGNGAIVGAGSVVTCDVPDGAIAVGVPAYVVKMRSDLSGTKRLPHAVNQRT